MSRVVGTSKLEAKNW